MDACLRVRMSVSQFRPLSATLAAFTPKNNGERDVASAFLAFQLFTLTSVCVCVCASASICKSEHIKVMSGTGVVGCGSREQARFRE